MLPVDADSSDYPHAEGFVAQVRQTRECLASLQAESIVKILCVNTRKFYRILRERVTGR